MAYILKPSYGDMSVVILGSNIESIKSKLKIHWEDELSNPEEYYENHIENIHFILNKEYTDVFDLVDDYNTLIDEDYRMESSR